VEMCSPGPVSTRVTYTTAQLNCLRQQQCVGIPRKTRRLIFSLGIRNKLHTCLRPKNIPVKITSTRRASWESTSWRQRELLQVPLQPRQRAKRSVPVAPPTSVMLSNLRSISNKFDEVSFKINEHRPDVAIFTESWLCPEIPDSSLTINGYSICRKDRSRNGGGIIAYISERYSYRVLNDSDIPSLGSCDTEILPIVFSSVPFIIICLYHPFWNDSVRDEKCISCMCDMLDFALTNTHFDPCKLRLMICGDFNGLHQRYENISQVTQLIPVVKTPTRGPNVLDQIFCNFSFNCQPKVLPPIGKSDHCVVLWCQSARPRLAVRKVLSRKFSASRKALLNELIVRTDWLALVEAADDVDSCAFSLLWSLFFMYDFCFPARSVRFLHG